jgi:hypothetical protein
MRPFLSALPLIISFVVLEANAQPNCKVVQDHLDDFTGTRLLQITAEGPSTGPGYDWLVKNGQVCLMIRWERNDNRPAVVFEGDSLFVKLENDSVMVLVSKETMIGNTVVKEDGTKVTSGVYCYIVGRDQLKQMGSLWVQKLRIFFRDGYQEFNAVGNPDWQMGMWRTSNCVMQSIGMKPSPQFSIGAASYGGDR